MKRLKVILTVKQAELLLWAVEAGLEQHGKFLNHDGWDYGLSVRDRHRALWPNRKFKKAAETIKTAIAKAERNEK